MIINKCLLLLLLLTFISCDSVDKNEYILHYPNGNLNILQVKDTSEINDIDLNVFKNIHKNNYEYYHAKYNLKGKLLYKGVLDSFLIRTGKWHKYAKSQRISQINEYYNIHGKEYLNRSWILDAISGDTIKAKAYALKVNKDTIKIDEELKFYFYLTYPYLSYNSDLMVLIPSNGYKLKDDFSNENLIKWDTIDNYRQFFLKNDKPIKKHYNLKTNVTFVFSKPGLKRIKGIILERCHMKDTIIKKYFIKEIFVTPRK